MNTFFLPTMAFLFGICIGSFLNAVIYRLPRGISLSKSRSHCPSCDKLIYWYENIPLISYLFLRGKCSNCDFKIPFQYPLVELTVGIAALFLTPRSLNPTDFWQFFFFVTVFAAFLAIVIIDLRHFIIPNVINIYLAVVFLVSVVLIYSYKHWLIGAIVGFGLPYGIAKLFYKLKGVEGLGGGDIKLWAALGIYLGPIGTMYNFFLSGFIGSLIFGTLMIFKVIDRNARIPFGPCIVAAATLQIFFPKQFDQLMGFIFAV